MQATDQRYRLGTFFNATEETGKQAEAEQWIRKQYPEIWAELEKLGIEDTEEGWKLVKIDRRVRP